MTKLSRKTFCFRAMSLLLMSGGLALLGTPGQTSNPRRSAAEAGAPQQPKPGGPIVLDTNQVETSEYDAGKLKFIATARQTRGAYSVVELIEMPGYKTAWHRHNNCEETFFVLEGVLTIKIDGRTHRMPAGSYISIPRGTPHGQGNFGDKPLRLLTTFTPGGFDEFFIDRVELFKTIKPGDPAFRAKFDGLRAKHNKWVEILGTWEPDTR